MSSRPRPRAVAIALPVKNEEAELPACLSSLDAAAGRHDGPVTVVALANDCRDGSVDLLARWPMRHARLAWRAVSLLPGARHAGWARRLAFDGAAAWLEHATDVLMSTDADTAVAADWIVRACAHLDAGADAVAGRAFTRRADRAALGCEARRRLDLLGRYYTALDWLRAAGAPDLRDPWPRHFYEGGASIALTLARYRAIGGAPTPPVAEDRALFAAVRASGGRVRHPIDVRVFTSSRLEGRAPGGMADTFAGWITQDADAPLHETYRIAAALDPGRATARDQLSFATLPAAITEAQARIAAIRSRAAPQVEPISVMPVGANRRDRVAEQPAQVLDGLVAALGVVGLAGPVDEQQVSA